MLADEPAHLLSVIEALELSLSRWQMLREKLNPMAPAPLRVRVHASPRSERRRGRLQPSDADWSSVRVRRDFVQYSILFGIARLSAQRSACSAGTRAWLINLEQKVVKLLRKQSEGDTRALSSAIDAAEARVTRRHERLEQEDAKQHLAAARRHRNDHLFDAHLHQGCCGLEQTAQIQVLLFFCVGLLALGVWALQALLNLLRSVGDALLDLVQMAEDGEVVEPNLFHGDS